MKVIPKYDKVKAVVELVVAEPVEASKRPREKATEDGVFDRFSHGTANI